MDSCHQYNVIIVGKEDHLQHLSSLILNQKKSAVQNSPLTEAQLPHQIRAWCGIP